MRDELAETMFGQEGAVCIRNMPLILMASSAEHLPQIEAEYRTLLATVLPLDLTDGYGCHHIWHADLIILPKRKFETEAFMYWQMDDIIRSNWNSRENLGKQIFGEPLPAKPPLKGSG